MLVFRNRDIVAPNKSELLWGLLCWFCYMVGFPVLFGQMEFFAEDSLQVNFLYNLTISVCSFLLVLFVFRNFLYRSRLPFLMVVITCFFGYIGTLGLDSLVSLFLSFLVPLLQESPTNMNQEIVNSFLFSYTGFMIVDVALLAPFIEELLFRGTIFAPLCRRSPFWAYVVSMAAFAGLHVVGFIGVQHWTVLLFSFVQYLPGGFVLCWSYQRSRSIWPPIVLHGFMNLYSSIMILSMT